MGRAVFPVSCKGKTIIGTSCFYAGSVPRSYHLRSIEAG
jgi:hypothetical protein